MSDTLRNKITVLKYQVLWLHLAWKNTLYGIELQKILLDFGYFINGISKYSLLNKLLFLMLIQ